MGNAWASTYFLERDFGAQVYHKSGTWTLRERKQSPRRGILLIMWVLGENVGSRIRRVLGLSLQLVQSFEGLR